MRSGHSSSAFGVASGTGTGSTGRSPRGAAVLPSTCAGGAPTTLTRTTRATTTGTATTVASRAALRSGSGGRSGRSAPGSGSVSASEVDDGTGQRAGDAVDRLHAGDDQAAELVDRLGLGADDHVVGAGDVLGFAHAVDLGDRLRHLGCLADFGLDEDVGVDHGRPFLRQLCRYVAPARWRTERQPTAAAWIDR